MMQWIIISACVVGAWSMLRIVGGERQRRIEEAELMVKIQAELAKARENAIPELREVNSR
jgi:hypothetical protein